MATGFPVKSSLNWCTKKCLVFVGVLAESLTWTHVRTFNFGVYQNKAVEAVVKSRSVSLPLIKECRPSVGPPMLKSTNFPDFVVYLSLRLNWGGRAEDIAHIVLTSTYTRFWEGIPLMPRYKQCLPLSNLAYTIRDAHQWCPVLFQVVCSWRIILIKVMLT